MKQIRNGQRSSRPGVFCKTGVLRNFTKFTGTPLVAASEWKKFLPVRNNENIRTDEEDNIYVSDRLHEEFPEVQNRTEWSVFQVVFDDIIDLLVQNTNLYASRDR